MDANGPPALTTTRPRSKTTPVAHDDDPHVRRHLSFGHLAGNDLRPDAGAIAQEQSEDLRHFLPFLPTVRIARLLCNL